MLNIDFGFEHQTPTNATHVSVGPSAPHREEILPSTNDNEAAGNQLEAEVTHRSAPPLCPCTLRDILIASRFQGILGKSLARDIFIRKSL